MHLTAREVEVTLGVGKTALAYWKKLGLIDAMGTISRPQALSLAVIKVLKGMRVWDESLKQIARKLWVMTEEEIEQAFAAGRCYLLIGHPTVLPVMLTREAAENPEGVDLNEYTRKTGLPPALMHLKVLWDGIASAVDKLRRGEEEPARTTPAKRRV